MVQEDHADGAREKGPDPFMDEYAFILQHADDLTLVTPFWHTGTPAHREAPIRRAGLCTGVAEFWR